MKKLLTILTMLFGVVLSYADNTTIFTAEDPVVTGEWSNSVHLSGGLFSEISENENNKIRIYFTDLTGDYQQLFIQSSSWTDINGVSIYNIQSGDSYYEYSLTGTLLSTAKSGGLFLRNQLSDNKRGEKRKNRCKSGDWDGNCGMMRTVDCNLSTV